MAKKKIAKTNNAGEKRRELSVEDIMGADNYYFKAKYVGVMFDHKATYKKFCKDYIQARNETRGTNYLIAPKPKIIKAYSDYMDGKIDINTFKNRIDARSSADFKNKVGRVALYVAEAG